MSPGRHSVVLLGRRSRRGLESGLGWRTEPCKEVGGRLVGWILGQEGTREGGAQELEVHVREPTKRGGERGYLGLRGIKVLAGDCDDTTLDGDGWQRKR